MIADVTFLAGARGALRCRDPCGRKLPAAAARRSCLPRCPPLLPACQLPAAPAACQLPALPASAAAARRAARLIAAATREKASVCGLKNNLRSVKKISVSREKTFPGQKD
jgi:hypothetical protein